MIHHKDFPFDEESAQREIIHVKRNGAGSATTLKIVLLALLFASIMFGVKYLYDLGRGSVNPMEAPFISANTEPYKIMPTDPGGMEIPHIDKQIFDGITPNFNNEEQIISPIDSYEKPIKNDAIADLIEESNEPKPKVKPLNIASTSDSTSTSPKISTTTTPKPKIIDANGVVTSSVTKRVIIDKSKKVDVDKVLAKQKTPEYWVQLGTFSTEEQATQAWQEVREKNSDILKAVTTKVSKSDLGEKGIFYRLKSGPISSDVEAKELCKQLNERQQNCFFVREDN